MIDLRSMQAQYAVGRLGAAYPKIDHVRALIATVERLSTAARALMAAREAGADAYEVRAEMDAMELALAIMDGHADKVCNQCGKAWEPRHLHLDDIQWVVAARV